MINGHDRNFHFSIQVFPILCLFWLIERMLRSLCDIQLHAIPSQLFVLWIRIRRNSRFQTVSPRGDMDYETCLVRHKHWYLYLPKLIKISEFRSDRQVPHLFPFCFFRPWTMGKELIVRCKHGVGSWVQQSRLGNPEELLSFLVTTSI